MRKLINNRGFAIWELSLAVVVLVLLGLAGYKVYSKNQNDLQNSTSMYNQASNLPAKSVSSSQSSTSTPSVPAVNNVSDLNSLESSLDSVNPSSSNTADSNQLSSQTNF